MRVPDVGVLDMPLLPSAGAHINSKNLRTPLNNRNRWDLKNQLWHLKLSNSSQSTPAASSASQLTACEKNAQFGKNTSAAPREVHLHDPSNLAVRPPPVTVTPHKRPHLAPPMARQEERQAERRAAERGGAEYTEREGYDAVDAGGGVTL